MLISFTLIKDQVRGFLAGSVVKDLPANTGDADWIPSPGWKDPLEKKTHSHSCLGNPTDKKPGGLQSMGSQMSWAQLDD